jgi:curved DNA-binding protein CbpA
MSTRADFYSILGVSRDTDAREIKRAYRELARKYHPDASGNDTSEIFKEINHAYEVLADPELKKKYDGVERHQFRYAYGYTYSPYQNQNSGEYPACYPNCVVVYLDE